MATTIYKIFKGNAVRYLVHFPSNVPAEERDMVFKWWIGDRELLMVEGGAVEFVEVFKEEAGGK